MFDRYTSARLTRPILLSSRFTRPILLWHTTPSLDHQAKKGEADLTAAQRAEIRAVFDHFDADGSGAIEPHELGDVMRAMGQRTPSEAQPLHARSTSSLDDRYS